MSKTEKPTTEIVLAAIVSLHNQEQIVTRETLSDVTGLTLAIIDDRVSHLVDTGLVRRVQRGVFVPVTSPDPARIITRSLTPDGTTVLEIGDQVLILTPREARMLGEVMAGSGNNYATLEMGRLATEVASDLNQRMKQLRKEFYASRAQKKGRDDPQPDLLGRGETEGEGTVDA